MQNTCKDIRVNKGVCEWTRASHVLEEPEEMGYR